MVSLIPAWAPRQDRAVPYIIAEDASVNSQASRTWSRRMDGMCVSSNSSGSLSFNRLSQIDFISSGLGTTTLLFW